MLIPSYDADDADAYHKSCDCFIKSIGKAVQNDVSRHHNSMLTLSFLELVTCVNEARDSGLLNWILHPAIRFEQFTRDWREANGFNVRYQPGTFQQTSNSLELFIHEQGHALDFFIRDRKDRILKNDFGFDQITASNPAKRAESWADDPSIFIRDICTELRVLKLSNLLRAQLNNSLKQCSTTNPEGKNCLLDTTTLHCGKYDAAVLIRDSWWKVQSQVETIFEQHGHCVITEDPEDYHNAYFLVYSIVRFGTQLNEGASSDLFIQLLRDHLPTFIAAYAKYDSVDIKQTWFEYCEFIEQWRNDRAAQFSYLEYKAFNQETENEKYEIEKRPSAQYKTSDFGSCGKSTIGFYATYGAADIFNLNVDSLPKMPIIPFASTSDVTKFFQENVDDFLEKLRTQRGLPSFDVDST